MVNTTVINGSSLLIEATTLVSNRFEWIYSVMKGIGIVLIFYLIYLGYNAYIAQKSRGRVKRIEEMLIEVNRKLDVLIDDKKKRDGKSSKRSRGKSKVSRK